MLDLNQMSVFIRVVQDGSFTAAARSLSIPKSRVSRMITDLEDKLSLRLLERTTREIRPTDIGLQYYEQYKPLFEEIIDIHERISDNQKEPSGHLRVSAPVGLAIDMMGYWMASFKETYPLIDLEIVFNDGNIHLIRDGFDVGFALGHLEDSSLIARKVDDTDPILCASPEFIKKYGPFDHPEQLKNVPWIKTGTRNGFSHRASFIHKESGERIEINQPSSVTVNHLEIAKHHMLAGQGVAITSTFLTYEALTEGRLQILLPQWQIEQEPFYLVFPSGKHQPKKVRAFIDHFIAKSNELDELIKQFDSSTEDDRLVLLKKLIVEKRI
ncbi:LysR family transcriptional regulator [Oceaniserpentilla sp. 4NH20-0058]|uniref:LysR family transcriptional regulator n=1 Tax=Oceaniserpentilla sp. 4NH20-0058 TaxID=3127660 RepID=UPI003103B89D